MPANNELRPRSLKLMLRGARRAGHYRRQLIMPCAYCFRPDQMRAVPIAAAVVH
ncbi:hypothetical protein KCP69_18540 [Salmonella enterica subsp. enterica]|nr:hypothetical protein KCP69_18540 [Salmonella enterica subsp. enterica]